MKALVEAEGDRILGFTAFGVGAGEVMAVVQVAAEGDDVADASTPWPAGREEVPFGTITLTARVDDQEPGRRKIIFDPVPRVDGIDPSGDPLTPIRSDIYLLSGRERRAASSREG
jgi:catalase